MAISFNAPELQSTYQTIIQGGDLDWALLCVQLLFSGWS